MLRSSNSLFLLSPWGTQPATTRAFSFFLPSRRVEDMAASLGPFTVHVFISHRSAESLLSSGSSLASIKYKKSASVCLAEPMVALYHIDAPKGKPPSCKMNSMAHGVAFNHAKCNAVDCPSFVAVRLHFWATNTLLKYVNPKNAALESALYITDTAQFQYIAFSWKFATLIHRLDTAKTYTASNRLRQTLVKEFPSQLVSTHLTMWGSL